jgi:hypothetical protein
MNNNGSAADRRGAVFVSTRLVKSLNYLSDRANARRIQSGMCGVCQIAIIFGVR